MRKILFLFAGLLCFFIGQSQYRLGFRVANIQPGEQFWVRVNMPPGDPGWGEPYLLSIDQSGVVYCPWTEPAGASVFFMPQAGISPRTCLYNGNNSGVAHFTNADVIIDLACGSPPTEQPTHPFFIRIDNIIPGEVFKYFLSGRPWDTIQLNYNQKTARFATLFRKGDLIEVSTRDQVPRFCSYDIPYVIKDTGNTMVLNCGTAGPDRKVILTTSAPGTGENFEFIIERNYRRVTTLSVTSTNYQNVATALLFSKGDTLRFYQSLGPRNCNPAYSYIVPDTGDLRINLNCAAVVPGKVGITVNRPPVGKTLTFRCEKNGQTLPLLVITGPNQTGYFQGDFQPGDTVVIWPPPMSETLCLFDGQSVARFRFTQNRLIKASCGFYIALDIDSLASNERFQFEISSSDGQKDTLVYQLTNTRPTYFAHSSFYQGDTIHIRQLSGPRMCNLPAMVLMTGFHTTIRLSCSKPGDGSVGGNTNLKNYIAGTIVGTAGSRLAIRSGKNEELNITIGANGSSGFRFPREYAEGEQYSVSIKTAPPTCNCAILPAASGTMPVDSTELTIICKPPIELASRSTDNKITNTFYETSAPVVGGRGADEGRYVAFVSSGTGLDGSSGKYRQVYLRDMKTGTTKMISRAPDGSEGNNNSFAPAISLDGRSVAFESYATNLAGGDNNGVRDVYVWKEGSGVNWVSQGGNGESYEPRIDGDGSSIVFSSGASTLVAGVEGTSTVNTILWDNGSFTLLSKDPRTGKGVGGAAPDISANGNIIVFCSFSDKLVQDDRNGLWDIFIYKRGIPVLKRISNTSGGGDRDQGTESASRVVSASISGQGSDIVFSTTATNMVSGDNNKMQDIFMCNNNGLNVRRISVTSNNIEGDGDSPIEQGGRIGISYDGKWVCYNTNAGNLGLAKGNIVLQNTQTGKIIPVTNSIYNTSGRPMISAMAAYVVAGCSEKLDGRFTSSGIFEFFTGASLSQ